MRILIEESAALVIDIQERLFPHMHEGEALLRNCIKFIEGLQVLSVPLFVTQQYTKGLGMTIAPVLSKISDFSYIEKISFSCCDEPQVMKILHSLNRPRIVICGIETHVCVLQTCLDLLKEGFIPVVAEDCTSSRNPDDKKTGIERIRQEGGIITSMESILFELTRKADSSLFKKISAIVK